MYVYVIPLTSKTCKRGIGQGFCLKKFESKMKITIVFFLKIHYNIQSGPIVRGFELLFEREPFEY